MQMIISGSDLHVSRRTNISKIDHVYSSCKHVSISAGYMYRRIYMYAYVYTGLQFLMKIMIVDRYGSDWPWAACQIREIFLACGGNARHVFPATAG